MRHVSRFGSHSSLRVLVHGNARVCALMRYGTLAFVAFLSYCSSKVYSTFLSSSRIMRSHCQEFEVLLIVVADVVVVNDRVAFVVIMVVMASVIAPFVDIPSNQSFLISAMITPSARGAPEV